MTTRADSASIWPIVKAHAEGKEIQFRVSESLAWETIEDISFGFLPHRYRIAPAKVRVTGVLNVYPEGSYFYSDKDNADRWAAPHRIACIEIDVEGERLG